MASSIDVYNLEDPRVYSLWLTEVLSTYPERVKFIRLFVTHELELMKQSNNKVIHAYWMSQFVLTLDIFTFI